MQEKLIIQNFGPIKHVELDLKKVNVLIGDQGTGKSTVAKVLAMLLSLSKEKDFNGFLKLLEDESIITFLRKESKILLEVKTHSIKIEYGILSFENSNETVDRHAEIDTIVEEFPNNFIKILSKATIYRTKCYIPTERQLVQYIIENPFDINIKNLHLGLRNFGSIYNDLQRRFKELEIKFENRNDLSFKILFNENPNELKVEFRNQIFSISDTSSGIQSLIPMMSVIHYYIESRGENIQFIIEEPEQNLFPISQYEVVKYLLSNCLSKSNNLLLTTHSPYILTSLNNLIQAHITGTKEGNEEKVNTIIDKKYWLDPKDVSAYMLKFDEQEGGVIAENILDEDGLIRAEKIDGVSRILNEEFDRLLDIDFNIEK
ncbi:MAG: ATP-binding protein [Chitinophagales bacterium]|nr:ATP-binding protein [Chitinophagales bacterium]